MDDEFVGYGQAPGCTCLGSDGRIKQCDVHPTRLGRTKDWKAMNDTRAAAGLPPLAPHSGEPMAIMPRVIEGGPVNLRPVGKKASSAPLDLLLAATVLIPNQPTTEQWQTLKQAILDL